MEHIQTRFSRGLTKAGYREENFGEFYDIMIRPHPGTVTYAIAYQDTIVARDSIMITLGPENKYPPYNVMDVLMNDERFMHALNIASRANGVSSKQRTRRKIHCVALTKSGKPCKSYRLKGYDKCTTHKED